MGLGKKASRRIASVISFIAVFVYMNSVVINNCTLCQSGNIQKIFIARNQHGRHLLDGKDTFPVYSCGACGSVFLGGLVIDSNYYKNYYKLGYYEQVGGSVLARLVTALSKFSVYVKQKLILVSVGKKDGSKVSILDVGCGSGGFLSKLDTGKFIKTGIEINPEGAALCRKNGLEVYDLTILDIDFGGRVFDVVTMWHVLEHVPNPVEVLKKISTILSRNGVLVFEVPNTDSFGFQYGKADWFHLDSPRHLVLYSKKSATKLCELAGFTITRIQSSIFDYPLDLFWSIRTSPIRYIFYPLYLFVKLFSRETLLFICKKT